MLVAQEHESVNAVEIGDFGILTKPIFVERATDAILAYLPDPKKRHVLIADEDPHVREILTEALTPAGCRITVASDGAETVRLASARKPDVLLLSLTLRGANGLTSLANLRANVNLKAIPILMLVPRELAVEQMEQLQSSVSELIESGEVSPRSLVETVRTALAVNRPDLAGTGSR